MYAADVAYAPIAPTRDAVRKALEARNRVGRIQRAHPLKWAGVVLSGFDLRVGMDEAIYEEARQEFGDEIGAVVPRRATVHEAFQLGERLGDRRDVSSSNLAVLFRDFMLELRRAGVGERREHRGVRMTSKARELRRRMSIDPDAPAPSPRRAARRPAAAAPESETPPPEPTGPGARGRRKPRGAAAGPRPADHHAHPEGHPATPKAAPTTSSTPAKDAPAQEKSAKDRPAKPRARFGRGPRRAASRRGRRAGLGDGARRPRDRRGRQRLPQLLRQRRGVRPLPRRRLLDRAPPRRHRRPGQHVSGDRGLHGGGRRRSGAPLQRRRGLPADARTSSGHAPEAAGLGKG